MNRRMDCCQCHPSCLLYPAIRRGNMEGAIWRGQYGGAIWRGQYGGGNMEGAIWRGQVTDDHMMDSPPPPRMTNLMCTDELQDIHDQQTVAKLLFLQAFCIKQPTFKDLKDIYVMLTQVQNRYPPYCRRNCLRLH